MTGILPHHLQSWQPQADKEQLAEFIRRHATLLRLLEESWQQFAADYAPPAPAPTAYAEGFSIESLSHSPLDAAESAAFAEHFSRREQRRDRPFGDHVEIRDHGWQLADDNNGHDARRQPESHPDTAAAEPPFVFAQALPMQPENPEQPESPKQPESRRVPHRAPQPSEPATAPAASTTESEAAAESAMPIFPHSSAPAEPAPAAPAKLPPLPNGRQGEAYAAALPAEISPPERIEFDPPCGLNWDAEHAQISGTPDCHGSILLRHIRADGSSAEQTLYINPDPKSLWRNLPAPADTPFYKSDSARSLIATPHGRIVAARRRGRSHAHNGSCCDDDFAVLWHAGSQAAVLAVSDGAGSAAFSRYGSEIAVQAAVRSVETALQNDDIRTRLAQATDETQRRCVLEPLFAAAVAAADAAQDKAVAEHEIITERRQLAATLLLALLLPLDDQRWLAAACQIGDGAIAAWQPESQSLTLLGAADSGEYSGETRFLAADTAGAGETAARLRIFESQGAPVLLLMSDGVSDPKFGTDAQLEQAECWQALWQETAPLLTAPDADAALETWLDFWSHGNHDDRTLAAFVPENL